MSVEIRTRFAPSPTGYMHVGSLRTALYAWLLARQNNGSFILRIEDTDKSREVDGSIDHVIKCLNSLGLEYDEGPKVGGDYGPYLQSQRLEIYHKWVQKLLDNQQAYCDPYTKEEVDNFKLQSLQAHKPFHFRDFRPKDLNYKPLKGSSIRFKSSPKDYTWNDAVMGQLSATEDAIDDFVLIKSDGYPTYNFAHIIDDYEMKISHVIRGHEFIASVPNYLNLYEALSFSLPIFATPPPVLRPDGKKKLSKRDGAKDILDYLEDGFLKEALINFMATLGWNDGTTQEIFSIDELIASFSLDRIHKSGALFDNKRLIWMNGQYIRKLDINTLYDLAKNFWPPEAQTFDKNYKLKVLGLLQERLKFLAELSQESILFFKDLPINTKLISDNKHLNKISNSELRELLQATKASLEQSNFSLTDLQHRLNDLLEKFNQTPAILFSLIRIATTQASSSPALADTLAVLGKPTTIRRIDNQLTNLDPIN